MVRSEIFTGIGNILHLLVPKGAGDLTESTSLAENLGLHSSRFVEFVIELEDKFNIRICDADVAKMRTVGDAVTLVSKRAAA
jgi:acyl carrier protein